MKEFGSDFHFLPIQDNPIKTIGDHYPDATYYATGRQALIDLYKKSEWKSLWVPEYFCYEVLDSLRKAGLKLKFYYDLPLNDEREELCLLPFKDGDALLRVNYFGLRSKRKNDKIPVPVIEDHTHDLIGNWVSNSDADWCFASIRKSLPLPEGGILWSPKGMRLKEGPKLTAENVQLANRRWIAMKNKTAYLNGICDDKNTFRPDMISTEEQIGMIPLSSIDDKSLDYVNRFDIDAWFRKKKQNRELIKSDQFVHFVILESEDSSCYPFSLPLLFDTALAREKCREYLIKKCIYPAVLWNVPQSSSPNVVDFSKRILSIHCDARYNVEDILYIRDILADFQFEI